MFMVLSYGTSHFESLPGSLGNNCYGGVAVFHKLSPDTLKMRLPTYTTFQCVGTPHWQQFTVPTFSSVMKQSSMF